MHVGLANFQTFPQKERNPRVEHPNYYWLQEDYIKQMAAEPGTKWTCVRGGATATFP